MKLVEKNNKRINNRLMLNNVFKGLFFLATFFGIVVLAILVMRIVSQGASYLDWDFLSNYASRKAEDAGIKAAIYGTVWIMAIVAPVSLILGVGTAIYLEEYAPDNKFTHFIELNISNLSGVPSIVFGLLGLTVFVRLLEMGRSVLAGGLTMSLMILPVIVVSSQEAIRAIPKEQYEASYAMGATKWQTIRTVVLPAAVPGILTGSILALSRAVGETAPLLMIGAMTFIAYVPESILSGFTAMPIQIFNWAGRPQEEFQAVAAAGSIVLMLMLVIMNSLAIYIRNKFSKRY
ncbi:phosphate ABC transporter permease PstA [Trichococcus shcherbakoviae]|uniref:Phosphate transport system permease protein PstA n=2 Tax=Trichococcus shcherbakoviae TaxID=2094020 RepID=A0A383TIR0_9LACT|nr:phosphate ABC transporter permease PstA [Trichococcus shcherbakoviae]OUL08047.1 phosphate ABC transporter, permease protein PstA [Sedimentibacter sp. SX930]TNV68760.1 phosphate ABC transporter permease PstA [Trichococcus shcherbakoviae subsp. psychrophilus]SYZ79767.1 phosphate transport system permease protein psta [Trichococcus shcherbakoviae]